MMIFRRVLGGLCVAACLGAQSCRQEAAEPTAKQSPVKETVYKEGNIELPLYADLGVDLSEETSQLKALDASVGTQKDARGRLSVDYGKKFPVICIIRSDKNDPITYIDNIEAVKQPNGVYQLNKERVHLAQGSALAAGKKWYMMVVTKNSFNKNNGELSINANGEPETLTAGATRVMDIPAASAWIELPTFANGQPKWPKDWTDARRQAKLTLYPQGVLCRATLRLDNDYKAKLGNNSVDLKVTQLKVVSTALSFSGKFKFDKASLPPLTQTSGRPTIVWEATQAASATREYRALDANTAEYQKIFNAPANGAVLQVSGSGSSAALFSDSNSPAKVENAALKAGVQSILFWAVPVKGATNRHTTLIAETGSSSSDKVLQPSHTYIYGKKHTKDAQAGRVVSFDAVYYNPYTPLDYMAEYNVARKDPGQFYPGGKIPQGWSGAFASDHTPNSSTFLQWWDIDHISLTKDNRTYSNPTHGQFHSVIPYSGDAALNLKGGGPVNNALVIAQLGDKKSNTKFSSRKKGDANVRYALALTDFDGSQKYRVAYRYELKEYQQTYPVNYLSLKKVVLPSRVAKRTPPYFVDATTFGKEGAPVYFKRIELEIKAVQLGTDFVGSVDDIANEGFWSTANLRTEVRILPQSYSAYRSYLYPDGIDASVGRRIKEDIFRSYGDNNWGASYATLGRENEATPFYLGDNILAVFAASQGVWANADMNAKSQYVALRFPVRLFTKQSR
jgi:lipoprotein